MEWGKVEDMGFTVGDMYINGQYLYASTIGGVFRLLIGGEQLVEKPNKIPNIKQVRE